MEKINNSDLINATRLLKRQKRQIEAVKRLHESCGQRKRNPLPGVAMDIEEKKELSKWEMVYLDTSGKFSIRST